MLICASPCTHKLAAVVVLLGANWISHYWPKFAYCACTHHCMCIQGLHSVD